MTYVWMGRPTNPEGPMGVLATQTAHFITPTQTIFQLQAGPVDLNVTFFSPVEYEDIQRQSIPVSYLTVDVASNDGAAHVAQIYMDITGKRLFPLKVKPFPWPNAIYGNCKLYFTVISGSEKTMVFFEKTKKPGFWSCLGFLLKIQF
jgi:hypothetical protein